MLERQMAEPEDPSRGGNLGNRYCVGINDLDNEYYPEDPAVLGAFAARHYKMRMAQNRLRSLRDFAALCGSLADTFEGRLSAESQIRRIQ